MNIEEWEELMEHVALPADEAIKASGLFSEKIDVTTLSSKEAKIINLSIHCNAPPDLKTTQLCYIATCVIIRYLRTHTSYNCCVYCRLPFDSINKIKGLQKLIDREEVTYMPDKCAVIHIRCFNSFDVYQESVDKMFRDINRWFSMNSSSEEIDYMEIIT